MRKQYISAKQKDARYVLATAIFFSVLTVSMVLLIIVEPSLLLEMNVSPLLFMSVVVAGIASFIPFIFLPCIIAYCFYKAKRLE